MIASPIFAVVGAVNHGKSSVVAALAEDDDVRISAMPGETVANRQFSLRDLLVFVDTPGFQNARKALAAIEGEGAGAVGDPLAPFAAFVERHRDDPEFEAECRLLRPIVDGAGIVYVVDGSRPLRDIHRAEMEILRRTGAPRLAIINRTTDDDHVQEWKGALDQHFNLVRAFDAHEATYADRKDLIESLASIERPWKERLRQAVDAMESDRRLRLDEAGLIVATMLADLLRHVERSPFDASQAGPATRESIADDLKRRYTAAVTATEHAAHRRLIALYSHRHVAPDAMPAERFAHELFAEETWRLFGLGVRQLVGLSTLAGGIAGAGIDAATLGHSFGLGAALGAAAGGGGALALGRRRPELSIDWAGGALPGFARALLPRTALRFGGGTLAVGPFKAENFPWILLDRACCLFAAVYTRSHARRDQATLQVDAFQPVLNALGLDVAQWPEGARTGAQSVFRALRGGRDSTGESIEALQHTVAAAFDRIAAAERPIGRATTRKRPAGETGGAFVDADRARNQSQLPPPSEPESPEAPPESQSLPP